MANVWSSFEVVFTFTCRRILFVFEWDLESDGGLLRFNSCTYFIFFRMRFCIIRLVDWFDFHVRSYKTNFPVFKYVSYPNTSALSGKYANANTPTITCNVFFFSFIQKTYESLGKSSIMTKLWNVRTSPSFFSTVEKGHDIRRHCDVLKNYQNENSDFPIDLFPTCEVVFRNNNKKKTQTYAN